MPSEIEQLAAWRAGDGAAGSALFERHFSCLFRFFRNKVEGPVDDLVQETFLACVRGRDRLHDDASFRAYLFGAARYVLYRHYHHRAHKEAPLDFGVSSVHDLGPSPSGIAAGREEQRLLVRALRRIPVDLQLALELYYFEDLSGPELAVALGIPEGTARSRLRRATERLEVVLGGLAVSSALLESTIADLEGWARGVRGLLVAEVPPA